MTLNARKAATIYLVIYALIFNAVATPMAFGAANSTNTQGVLFCTSSGYQWLEVDAEPSSKDSVKKHCKLCLFPPSDDNDASALHELAASAPTFLGLHQCPIESASPRHGWSAFAIALSRAPPLDRRLI